MIKVSVIMPIYNAEKYLEECILSVMKQSLKEIEIILIDDGSRDHSLEICKKLAEKDKRIQVYARENVGQGEERNFGISVASGEYIAFIDADDLYKTEMLELLYEKAKAENADIVSCGYENFYDSGEVDYCSYPKKKLETIEQLKDYMRDLIAYKGKEGYGGCIAVWNSIYSSEILKKYQISFLSERIIYSEDLLFKLHFLSKAKRGIILEDALYRYRISEQSFSNKIHSIVIERIIQLYQVIQREFSDFLGKECLSERNRNRLFFTLRYNLKRSAGIAEQEEFCTELCKNSDLYAILKEYKPTSIKNYLVYKLVMTRNKRIISCFLKLI